MYEITVKMHDGHTEVTRIGSYHSAVAFLMRHVDAYLSAEIRKLP